MKKFKGLTPCAVYEAHFADGSTLRMGFYNEAGKPINYVKGARTCALATWQNPALDMRKRHAGLVGNADIFAPRKPESWLGDGPKEIVDGYVFHDGKIIGRDPRMSGPAKYECDSLPNLDSRKPRQSIADLKALMVRVLRNEAEAIEAARKLVA